jgi:hypothetical protein
MVKGKSNMNVHTIVSILNGWKISNLIKTEISIRLKKGEARIMEGQWTFADLYEKEWVHDTFDTKEEAINAAKGFYDEECCIGQLEHEHGINYKVVNQEKISLKPLT